MPQGSPRQRREGFSLVEVLCSILILGVGLAGILEGITLALKTSKDSEHLTAAALLAAGRIETLRAEGYLLPGEEEGDFGEGFPLYLWRQTISETTLDGLYEVSVAVELASSREPIYDLKTLLFEMPLSTSSGIQDDTTSSPAFENPRRRGVSRGLRP